MKLSPSLLARFDRLPKILNVQFITCSNMVIYVAANANMKTCCHAIDMRCSPLHIFEFKFVTFVRLKHISFEGEQL